MGSSSSKFEIKGYNHIALTCSDMQKTVDFYEGVLGFPLVKTLEYPGGRGQHFFFQITEDDGIAFFWFAAAAAPQPGVSVAPWQPFDDEGRPVRGVSGVAAKDAMHHLSFDVPLEEMDEYRARLQAAGIEVTEIVSHSDNHQGSEAECMRSLYFHDPDGTVLEFSAWSRDLTADDVRDAPARAEDAAARLQPGVLAVTI